MVRGCEPPVWRSGTASRPHAPTIPVHLVLHDGPGRAIMCPRRLPGHDDRWFRAFLTKQMSVEYPAALRGSIVWSVPAWWRSAASGMGRKETTGALSEPGRGQIRIPCVRVRGDGSAPGHGLLRRMINREEQRPFFSGLQKGLEGVGVRLDIYVAFGRQEMAAAQSGGAFDPARGLPASKEMAEQLGKTAPRCCFRPRSIAVERDDVFTLFPSKLADYTAVGLPLIVWGPAYSSAVRLGGRKPGSDRHDH